MQLVENKHVIMSYTTCYVWLICLSALNFLLLLNCVVSRDVTRKNIMQNE